MKEQVYIAVMGEGTCVGFLSLMADESGMVKRDVLKCKLETCIREELDDTKFTITNLDEIMTDIDDVVLGFTDVDVELNNGEYTEVYSLSKGWMY